MRTQPSTAWRRSAILDGVAATREYTAIVAGLSRARVFVPVPFDPDQVWGAKAVHHIAGTVRGMRMRGEIETVDGDRGFVLGPAWRRDCGLDPGDEVAVVLEAEGPQRADLAPDIVAAFEREPAAGAFFDSLAQFYRNAYLRWIDGTKRRPELRESRIAEMVELLKAGHKDRPRP